jgi:hypothetical protein
MDRASTVFWAAPATRCSITPDILVEIADWESAEARMAHMQEAAASGVYAPLVELLAAPFRATVIRQLP